MLVLFSQNARITLINAVALLHFLMRMMAVFKKRGMFAIKCIIIGYCSMDPYFLSNASQTPKKKKN